MTRLQAAASRGLTRFVGRDTEMDHLRRSQQRAGAGHGQVAAIVGEAGVGKSRLVYEFTHSHRLQGWLVLEQAVDIRLDLRRALLPLGESPQILPRLSEAEDLARRLDDPRRLGWVKATLTHHFWQTGSNAEACRHGEEAVDLARTAGDPSLEIAASYYLAIAKNARAQYREADALCRQTIEMVGDDVERTVQAMVALPAPGARCVLAFSSMPTRATLPRPPTFASVAWPSVTREGSPTSPRASLPKSAMLKPCRGWSMTGSFSSERRCSTLSR